MNLESFKQSLTADSPPDGISIYLRALWFDGKGNWETSHHLIQDVEDNNAAWIHAYLHKKEGDIWNADYWYNRAGRKRPSLTLNEEWDKLAEHFLS